MVPAVMDSDSTAGACVWSTGSLGRESQFGHTKPLIASGTGRRSTASCCARSTTLSSDVDMNSSVYASAMFPQLRLSTSTGRLCSAGSARHRVPRRQRSYAALRLPRPRRPPLRSSLASGLPRCGGLFFTAAPVPPQTGATPETFLPRLPISRLSPEEKRGYPRCLGHPLRACRGPRPRRVRPPLARSR